MFAKLRQRIGPCETRTFGPFTLDLSRVRLLRDRDDVKLRPKSYEVLRYLVEHPGRVVTKQELTEAVWPDSFVTDDSLVQCIREVRRALDDDPPQLIKTVARRGYIFDGEVRMNSSLASEKVTDLSQAVAEQKLATINLELVGRSASWKRLVNGKTVTASLLLVGVLIAAVLFLKPNWTSNSKSTPPSTFPKVNSVAVLPFKVLNPESKDDYLGLGMADALITRLSALNQFTVRPTSAIQKYTNSEQDSLAAGREQRVDAVLEGSIQRSVDKVRVTVRLLNVEDGRTLWGYKCDEYCADVFQMQDMISATVASALALRLTADQNARLAKHYTENTEAYQLYLKGVFLRNQMTGNSLKKSIESFQKAIELDPRYALAYAGQACSYDALTYRGFIPLSQGEPRSKELGRKALELDDMLAEVHAALGERMLYLDWDRVGAEREYKRALELNPNEQLSNLEYPDVLLMQGRVEEAIAVSRSAVEFDPLSPRANKGLAWLLYYVGRYDDAIAQFKKTEELFPKYALINLGPSYEKKGMYDEAINGYLEAEARWGLPEHDIAALRQAYTTSGWRGYWKKRLQLDQEHSKRTPVQALEFAGLYMRLGEKDTAFAWLQKALERHETALITLSIDPSWESLRSDPRFSELLRQIGLSS